MKIKRIIAGLSLLGGLGLAAAMPGAALAAPAVHIDVSACGVLDGNGAGAVLTDDRALITSSGNGMLKCQGDVTPSSTGHAVNYDFANTGASCGTPDGSTTDWHETVSASGNATLTCLVH